MPNSASNSETNRIHNSLIVHSSTFNDQLENILMKCAPPGLDGVTTMMCGSCSNENAFRTVYKAYMNRERGTDEVSTQDCELAAENKGHGNNLSILAFRGGFHGRTTGCISCTNTRGKIKVIIHLTLLGKLVNLYGTK